MLLNGVEKALMNNPLRAALQRHVEARILRAMGGPVQGSALEIGCGRGVGARLILDVFGAERVDAFDLDPNMVARAQRRLGDDNQRARLWIGDAERIDAADASYEAVFAFAIIHHVPRWRAVLSEVFRVLRPGGRFYVEEVLRDFIVHPVTRTFLDHPLEDRFDLAQLRAALADAGFDVVASRSALGAVGWLIAEKPAVSS